MNKDKIKQEIEQHIVDLMIALQHDFGSAVDNELSPNQQLVLYLIGKRNLSRVKELAHHMNVSPSAVSQMMAKLEKMELVKRHVEKDNRRNTVVCLLPEGEKALKKMDARRHEVMDKYLSGLAENDLQAIHQAFSSLQRMIEDARKKGEAT